MNSFFKITFFVLWGLSSLSFSQVINQPWYDINGNLALNFSKNFFESTRLSKVVFHKEEVVKVLYTCDMVYRGDYFKGEVETFCEDERNNSLEFFEIIENRFLKRCDLKQQEEKCEIYYQKSDLP